MIEVLSVWYNEQFLAPYFLKHYEWADSIRIFVDSDTNDNTRAILSDHNVYWEDFDMHGGLDDWEKALHLTKEYSETHCDWVIVVDADEFIYHRTMPVPDYLKVARGRLVTVIFHEVYRHITDGDLDPSLPPLYQRRHGSTKVWGETWEDNVKPCVMRAGQDIKLGIGVHRLGLESSVVVTSTLGPYLYGVHWRHADPCFSVDRMLNGRWGRQSPANIERYGEMKTTREAILAECKAHETDPEVL